MFKLLLQKYGIIPVDAEYWLRQFDEEQAPQYDDLAHFGLTDAEQRAYRNTQALLEEFGE